MRWRRGQRRLRLHDWRWRRWRRRRCDVRGRSRMRRGWPVGLYLRRRLCCRGWRWRRCGSWRRQRSRGGRRSRCRRCSLRRRRRRRGRRIGAVPRRARRRRGRWRGRGARRCSITAMPRCTISGVCSGVRHSRPARHVGASRRVGRSIAGRGVGRGRGGAVGGAVAWRERWTNRVSRVAVDLFIVCRVLRGLFRRQVVVVCIVIIVRVVIVSVVIVRFLILYWEEAFLEAFVWGLH